MRRLFIKIVIFIALFLAIDAVIGVAIGRLHSMARGGDTQRYILINDSITDPALIFGSSRAIHHYNPDILSDSLGLSVYNCGSDGNGILLCYMQLQNILARYTPQLIVYDFLPGFDSQDEADNSKYLNWQRPFYGRNSSADSVFADIDATERIKMRINSYRYNSRLPQILSDWLSPSKTDHCGYRPEDGIIPDDFPEPLVRNVTSDSLKLKYLEKFVTSCQQANASLVFAVSPYYFASNNQIFSDLFAIADKYQVPVLYYYDDPRFVGVASYFYDSAHLNSNGADTFSSIIAHDLRNLRNLMLLH